VCTAPAARPLPTPTLTLSTDHPPPFLLFQPPRCGVNNIAVTQLLQCTADMVVTLSEGGLSPGMCALSFVPALAAGTLRVLPGFPCAVFSYTGIGADAVSASARRLGGAARGTGVRGQL
jgi:hypothetical protein